MLPRWHATGAATRRAPGAPGLLHVALVVLDRRAAKPRMRSPEAAAPLWGSSLRDESSLPQGASGGLSLPQQASGGPCFGGCVRRFPFEGGSLSGVVRCLYVQPSRTEGYGSRVGFLQTWPENTVCFDMNSFWWSFEMSIVWWLDPTLFAPFCTLGNKQASDMSQCQTMRFKNGQPLDLCSKFRCPNQSKKDSRISRPNSSY